MTALLTDNLPLLAGAPNGIKKLRELILELAVRGKLVPQDPTDEPASELLKRIAVEKEKLSPKVKKTGETSVCAGTFGLPESWCWASFGDIAQHNSGKTLDKGRNSGVPRDYITTSNLYWGRFELSGVRQMLIEEKDLARCTAVMNDLLICEGGEAGRAAVWDQEREICFQNHVHRARFFGGINPHYAQRCFERLNYSGEIAEYRKGVGISNMSSKSLASIPVPLPPVAEQYRIVVKVDELMALCDRLEAQQADAECAHAQLVQALLDSLAQARDAEDFAQSWQRLAEHFHTLFTTEPSIDALKQTLLQLAVMGKLVPQDPNDEPASDLLKRIADAKVQAASQGRGRKVKTATDYRASDTEVTVPAGWSLSTVGEVTICRDGERIPVSQAEREGRAKTYDYYGASGVIDKIDGYLFDKPLLLVGEDGANLINRSTPIAFMARGKYWVNNHAHVLDGVSEALLLYVQLYFNAIDLKPYVTGTAQPKMNQAKMNSIVLLLPPEAEQHRIVAKVDQLMALCDQLKARLNQARQVHEQLANALVEQAVA